MLEIVILAFVAASVFTNIFLSLKQGHSFFLFPSSYHVLFVNLKQVLILPQSELNSFYLYQYVVSFAGFNIYCSHIHLLSSYCRGEIVMLLLFCQCASPCVCHTLTL